MWHHKKLPSKYRKRVDHLLVLLLSFCGAAVWITVLKHWRSIYVHWEKERYYYILLDITEFLSQQRFIWINVLSCCAAHIFSTHWSKLYRYVKRRKHATDIESPLYCIRFAFVKYNSRIEMRCNRHSIERNTTKLNNILWLL